MPIRPEFFPRPYLSECCHLPFIQIHLHICQILIKLICSLNYFHSKSWLFLVSLIIDFPRVKMTVSDYLFLSLLPMGSGPKPMSFPPLRLSTQRLWLAFHTPWHSWQVFQTPWLLFQLAIRTLWLDSQTTGLSFQTPWQALQTFWLAFQAPWLAFRPKGMPLP